MFAIFVFFLLATAHCQAEGNFFFSLNCAACFIVFFLCFCCFLFRVFYITCNHLNELSPSAILIVFDVIIAGLFENGQEYQYSYQSYTLTGVREPIWFGSSFGIRGNLLIQKQGAEAILKVTFVRLILI